MAMRLGDIVGVVGAGFGGYMKGRQDYANRMQAEEDRAYQLRQRARAEAIADERDRLASGMITVDPGEMGPPTAEQEMAGGLRPPVRRRATEDEMQTGIAGLALRSGDVQGYNAAMDRSKKIKREAADKDFGARLLAMSDDELFENAKKWVNESPYVPAMLGYDPKTKSLNVTTADGSITRLDPARARAYLYSAHQIGQGDVAAGLQTMLSTSDSRETTAARRVGDANRTAGILANFGIEQDKLANDRARTAAAVAASRAQTAQANRGQMVQMVDKATGQPVIGHLVNVGGRSVFQPADLPVGLRLPSARPEVTTADIIRTATAIMEQGGPDGKPIGPEEAFEIARAALSPQADAAGGDEAALAKVAEVLRASRGGAKPEAGAGRGFRQPVGPGQQEIDREFQRLLNNLEQGR